MTTISKQTRKEIWKREIKTPIINPKNCIGCEKCIQSCPMLVLQLKGNVAHIESPDFCIECSHCIMVCPQNAIEASEANNFKVSLAKEDSIVSEEALLELIKLRRSVRLYEDKKISDDTVKNLTHAFEQIPSGTNRRDNHLMVLDTDEMNQLRVMVEKFMTKFFKLVNNPVTAILVDLMYGKKMRNLGRYYSQVFEKFQKLNKKDLAYFAFPYGTLMFVAYSEKWDTSVEASHSIGLYNSSLVGVTKGIGSCFTGFVKLAINEDKNIRKLLGMPKDCICTGAMVFGYPKYKSHNVVEYK